MLVVGDHTQPVYSLAFAPDGRLASAGKDGTARLWDLSGGAPVTLHHPDAVFAAAFSPTGDRLATGCADGRLRLWDPATGGQLVVPLEHPAPVCGVAFLAGGQVLAAAAGRRLLSGTAGSLCRWGLTGPRPVPHAESAPHGCWAVAATLHGKTLAWGGGNRIVTVWELTAQDRQTLPPLKKGALAVALTADGRTLAATDDYGVRLWDVADRRQRTTLTGHKGMVSALAFSPDGRTLASGSWDTRVTLWDVATGRERQSYSWAVGRVLAVAFSPDGLLAAAAGDGGRIVAWDVE
jgi:WD40 repeat protein